MAEEIRSDGVPEDPVIRLLEQTSRYGMDQETTLIYISSVNLMSILGLIGRRFGGKSNLSLPLPASLPALSQAPSGAAPAGGQSLDNLMGMLMKMLGGQGGGSTSGGQGINLPALLNMLSILGQHVDLNSLMSMMAGLLGSGAKAAPGPAEKSAAQAASPGSVQPAGGQKTAGEDKAGKREVPKIMKWDVIDDRKKA